MRGALRPRSDHARVPLRHLVELADGLRDLADLAALAAGGIGDLRDHPRDLLDRFAPVGHLAAGAGSAGAPRAHTLDARRDEPADLACRGSRSLRERAHFGRDHGEATALLAR